MHIPLHSPQYYEIYKYKEVIGISILFISVDLLGGVFNDLSLVFKESFDVVAGVTYSLVVVRFEYHARYLLLYLLASWAGRSWMGLSCSVPSS